MTSPDSAASVAELLAIRKTVSRVFRASTRDMEHARLDLELAAECSGRFHVFVRVLRALSENFSVGLRYASAGTGETVLLRVNGDHGSHRNPDGAMILEGPHLHSYRPPLLGQPPRPSAHARWASPLPPDHLALPTAWRTFCGQIALAPDAKVDRTIATLYASLAQLPLPGPSP
ncbi:MAG: hypothetical protein ABTD50_00650 [Polyangiaceae bacterium]